MNTSIEFVRGGVVMQSRASPAELHEGYVKGGWALVPIPRGSKAPCTSGWNKRENCVKDATKAHGLLGNVGLAHAYSDPPTCAVDIDKLDIARSYLREHGIDLDALMGSADAVGISSGRPNRAKLLYTLPEPLPTLKLANGALELRCATREFETVQDVLPPSIHPDGQPYKWVLGSAAKANKPPPLPEALLKLWRESSRPSPAQPPSDPALATSQRTAATLHELRELLRGRDSDADYDTWIKVAMALHYATGGSDDGLAVWDEWSARGEKYKGRADLEAHWRSFKLDVPRPVTIEWLRRRAAASPGEFSAVPSGTPGTRAVIQLKGGELHEHAAKCEAILGDDLFVREHTLVRIGGALEIAREQPESIHRDSSQAVIIPASTEYLRRRLNQLVQFETYRRREKEWVPTNCPKDLANNIAGQGDWPTLRCLQAIARAPFVRADGTVCESPGYDPKSQIFFAPNAKFTAVVDTPTRADAEHALATLVELFNEFPFATDAARSAFIANILTEAVRPAIDASPAFCYTAPTPGTGKTLLSEMPSRIVHGCGPSMRPWAEGNEELRKNLFASLLAGDRTIGYDNVPSGVKIRSPILCAFLTAAVYSDRKLGVSEVPALPNRSVVSLTGNNITPVGDLARRSLGVRLDANTDRLRDRRFRISDLRGHVAANRPELLVAVLTIVRAYITAGCPVSAIPLPSFEQWSKLARDPLLWLNMPDPVRTQLDETDDEVAPLVEVFRLIAESSAIGEREFTAADLASACSFAITALPAAMEAAGCSGAHDARAVGYWLRDKRDQIAGGWKLERLGAPNGISKWRLRKIA